MNNTINEAVLSKLRNVVLENRKRQTWLFVAYSELELSEIEGKGRLSALSSTANLSVEEVYAQVEIALRILFGKNYVKMFEERGIKMIVAKSDFALCIFTKHLSLDFNPPNDLEELGVKCQGCSGDDDEGAYYAFNIAELLDAAKLKLQQNEEQKKCRR